MTLVGRFFGWWGGELAALAPGGLADPGRATRRLLVAAPGPDGVALERRGRNRREAIGPLATLDGARLRALRAEARRGGVVVAVPRADLVTQRLTLPIAAARNLDSVMRFEIGRATPFAPEELYAAYRIAERRPEAGQIVVELLYAPRAGLAPALDALAAAALPVARVDAAGPDGAPLGLDLSLDRRKRGWSLSARALAALLALCLCLGALWTALALEARAAKAEALRAAMAAARRDLTGAAAPADEPALAAYRRKSGEAPAVEKLALLTALLPDDTWAETLSIQGDAIRFSGRSRDAAALIALLEEHPRFAAPAFRAPITRDGADGLERFSIAATFVEEADR